MNTAQRKKGFLLPLAILCILVVSMVAINGFGFIQQHTNQLSYKKDTLNIQEQKKQFSELAFKNDIVEKPSYSFRHLNLSGIYNLAFLTRTDFNNEVYIVSEQLEILKRLTESCAGESDLAIQIADYLIQYQEIKRGFGLIDLLNQLPVPLNISIKLLPCIRISPKSYKLNLNLASEKTLMAYFNINSSDAKKLSQYISDGTTPNHDSINLFIKKVNSEKTVIPILRNTVMSSQLDHKATVLEYKGETFAYLDTILDKEGSWVKNRNFFLWVPVY